MRLTVLGGCGAWPEAGQACSGFLVEHDFPAIGHKKIRVDGERIESRHAGIGVILLIIRDVSDGQA